MRQSTYDNNILSEAIITAKKLRALSLENAKYSLKEALIRKTLPLQRLVDLNHLPDIEFIDAVLEQKRAEEDEPELSPKGMPYLNNMHRKSKRNTDDDLDERSRFSDDDEFEIDYGDGNIEKSGKKDDDDEKEDEEKFSDKVVEERSRKWRNLYGRRNFQSSPAMVSSGVGSTKLSQNERNLLLKHAGLIKENRNFKRSTAIKDDLIRQRAGIHKSDKNIAKQVVNDLEIKKKLSK